MTDSRAERLFCHRKTGGIYRVITEVAVLEASPENGTYVVYAPVLNGQKAVAWIRPYEEFFDGRFEEIIQVAAEPPNAVLARDPDVGDTMTPADAAHIAAASPSVVLRLCAEAREMAEALRELHSGIMGRRAAQQLSDWSEAGVAEDRIDAAMAKTDKLLARLASPEKGDG
jgi:hypothetical protein